MSPLSFQLCIETMEAKCGSSRIAAAVALNYSIIRPVLVELGLRVSPNLSFCLAEMPDTQYGTAEQLADLLLTVGVAVLPCSKFYWSNPERGNRTIRVALARPEATARRAAEALAKLPSVARSACR